MFSVETGFQPAVTTMKAVVLYICTFSEHALKSLLPDIDLCNRFYKKIFPEGLMVCLL